VSRESCCVVSVIINPGVEATMCSDESNPSRSANDACSTGGAAHAQKKRRIQPTHEDKPKLGGSESMTNHNKKWDAAPTFAQSSGI
jgi:hypothetical protein